MQVKVEQNKLQQRLAALNKVSESNDDIITTESGGVAHISQSEKKCFVRYVNEAVKKIDSTYVPIDAEAVEITDLTDKTASGVVFCHLINHARPGTIKPSSINKGANISKFQMIENWGIVFDAAKQIGCTAVNLSADDCINGKCFVPLMGLLWQIMRIDILANVKVENSLELIGLKTEEETVQQFLKVPERNLLMRWVNKQVKQTKKLVVKRKQEGDEATDEPQEEQDPVLEVKNFEKDLMDVSVYIRLIHSIAPEALTQEEAEELLSNPDKKAVAERIIEIIRQFDLKQQFFITAEDIIAGTTVSSRLNMTCIAAIFEHFGIASMDKLSVTESRELKREILTFVLDQLQSQTTIASSQVTDVVKAARNLLADQSTSGVVDDTSKQLNEELEKMKQLNERLAEQLEQSKEKTAALEKQVQEFTSGNDTRVIELQKKIDLMELQEIQKEQERIEAEEEKERQRIIEARNARSQTKMNAVEENPTTPRGTPIKLAGGFAGFTFEEQLLIGSPLLWQPTKPTGNSLEDLIASQDSALKELKQLLIYYRGRLKNTREDLNYAMSLAGEKGEKQLMQQRFPKDQSLEYLQTVESIGEKKVGMLYKEGRFRKSWKQRQFIIVNNYIFYYGKSTHEPQGFMRLDDCTCGIVDKNEEKKEFTFVVKTVSRTMLLKAPSMNDMKAWMKCIAFNGKIDADLQDSMAKKQDSK